MNIVLWYLGIGFLYSGVQLGWYCYKQNLHDEDWKVGERLIFWVASIFAFLAWPFCVVINIAKLLSMWRKKC